MRLVRHPERPTTEVSDRKLGLARIRVVRLTHQSRFNLNSSADVDLVGVQVVRLLLANIALTTTQTTTRHPSNPNEKPDRHGSF